MSIQASTRATTVAILLTLASASPAAAQAGFNGPNVVGPPGLVNSGGGLDAGAEFAPVLSSNGGDVWMCVFTSNDPVLTNGGDTDLFWTRSRDLGATWSPASPLTPAFLTDTGLTSTDIEPAIASSGASAIVVWASTRNSANGRLGIFAAAGNPVLASWTTIQPVDAAMASDNFDDDDPCLAVGGGTYVVVWQRRESPSDLDLYFSRTTNSGATWSTAARLDPASATDSLSDSNPTIATDGAGHWIVVCETLNNPSGTGSDQELVAYRSSNNGVSWVGPTLVNSTATVDGSAFDGAPSLAVDVASGTWICTWKTLHTFGGITGGDSELAWAKSTDFGQAWQPAGILNSDFGTDQATSTGDGEACLRADQNGHFFVSWTRSRINDSDFDVHAARTDDLGANWTSPALLDIDGGSDSGTDARCQIATDGVGHWLGVWETNDNASPSLGSDLDVVATRFLYPRSDFLADYCYGYTEAGNPARCPCGNDSPITSGGGCLNSIGTWGQVGMIGAFSASAATQTISFSGVPPGGPALVFQGTGIFSFGLGTAFGDGRLCVGGTLDRLGVGFAGSTGNGALIFVPVNVSAGVTRHYQAWYRDAATFCTSSTFNLSSAFGTVWQP